MYILGISSFYHDSAAAIINKGEIIAAVQEERFSRKKNDSSFPINSIKYCLKEAKISIDQVDYFVFYEKPFLKFERLLETYLTYAPRGFKSFSKSMPLWIKEKLFQKNLIKKEINNIFKTKINLEDKLLFSEHHFSHASSAFYPSPFRNSAILTLDGVGEWNTTTAGVGNENKILIYKEINFPHSIGLLYSAFTFFSGFKVNSGEYKLMGLAPYGIPKYINIIKDNIVDIADDGSFYLNMKYFSYCTDLRMINKKFTDLFKNKERLPEENIKQFHMDIAASIQKVIEEIVIKLAINIKKETKQKNLCLSGGVALNCVSNGLLVKKNIFEKIWIQPASGDAGGALGCALGIYYQMLNKKRLINKKLDSMRGAYLGPSYSENEIKISLDKLGANYNYLPKEKIIRTTSKELADGKIVGWMNGRMEFGPRSLGSRSILADPRIKDMQKKLNLKIKFRESFRPFAPSILRNHLNEYFDLDVDSPYMLLIAQIKKDKQKKMSKEEEKLFGIDKLNITRSKIPGVTHVDYTGRIQTVHKETNIDFFNLISSFNNLTKCPLLINTSFNVRGEPIVCSPEDAYKCFMGTEIDILIIDNYILYKNKQNKNLEKNYKNKYKLD